MPVPTKVREYINYLAETNPDDAEIILSKLESTTDQKRLYKLYAKIEEGSQADNGYNVPQQGDYETQLKDNNMNGNPTGTSFGMDKDDLSDIRFMVNMLTHGNIADLVGGQRTAQGREEAIRKGTYILNNKIGLPGQIVFNEKENKFKVSATVLDRDGNKALKEYDLNQSDDWMENAATSLYAQAGEAVQEGPRIIGGLVGLTILGGAVAAGTYAQKEGLTSPLAAKQLISGAYGLSLGAEEAGNLTSEYLTRNFYKNDTEGMLEPATGDPLREATFSTATDNIGGSIIGRTIGGVAGGALAVGKAAGNLVGAESAGLLYNGFKYRLAAASPVAKQVILDSFAKMEDFTSKAVAASKPLTKAAGDFAKGVKQAAEGDNPALKAMKDPYNTEELFANKEREVNESVAQVAGAAFGKAKNAVQAGAKAVGNFAGKMIPLAKLAQVAMRVQLPILQGLDKQISTSVTGGGSRGSLIALLANVNKKVFDIGDTSAPTIDGLLNKLKTNTASGLQDVKKITSDPEIRNTYQVQVKTYAAELLKDIQHTVSDTVTGMKAYTAGIKSGIEAAGDAARGAAVTKTRNAVADSVQRLGKLEAQAAQLPGHTEQYSSEIKLLNDKIAGLTAGKTAAEEQASSLAAGTYTGVPKEEVGNKLLNELTNLKGGKGKDVNSLYSEVDNSPAVMLTPEQIQTISGKVDNALSGIRYNKISSKVKQADVEELFSPLGSLDPETGAFQISQGLTDKDVIDFNRNIGGTTNFLTGESKLNPTQQHHLMSLNESLKNDIDSFQTPAGIANRKAGTANVVKSAQFNDNLEKPLYGENLKQLKPEAAEMYSEQTGRKAGDSIYINAKSGSEVYDNFISIANENPTYAKDLWNQFSPELKQGLKDVEKSLRYTDGAKPPGIGSTKVLELDDFTAPGELTQAQESLAGKQKSLAELNNNKSSIEAERNKILSEQQGYDEGAAQLAVAKDVEPALEIAGASGDDAGDLAAREYTARAALTRRGISQDVLPPAAPLAKHNALTTNYDDALKLLDKHDFSAGSTLSPAAHLDSSVGISNKLSDAVLAEGPASSQHASEALRLAELNRLGGTLDAGTEGYLDLAYGKSQALTPEEMANVGAQVDSDNAGSHLHDLFRISTSFPTYAATGNAALSNLTGSGAQSGSRLLANRGARAGAWDAAQRGLGGLASIPTVPGLSRAPVTQMGGPVTDWLKQSIGWAGDTAQQGANAVWQVPGQAYQGWQNLTAPAPQTFSEDGRVITPLY